MADLDFQSQTIFFKGNIISMSVLLATLFILDFLSSSTLIMLKSILISQVCIATKEK